MAHKSIEVSTEISTTAIKTAASGGLAAVRFGGNKLKRLAPNYMPQDIIDRQALLRRFEGSIAVAGDLMDPVDSDRELQGRVDASAEEFIELGNIGGDTAVEVRTVMPEDSLLDPRINAQREKVIGMMGNTLKDEFGLVKIASNTHPIMPPKGADSTVAWGVLADEIDGANHQLGGDGDRVAMIAMTSSDYIDRFFGPQIAESRNQISSQSAGKILMLEHVGPKPEDNVLGVGLPSRAGTTN